MEKYRAIPKGYMRIGEIAKKAGVTVRTLSYYDKEGLLLPSGQSEGGYRLYTDKDMVKLIQILMLKELGFTLNEIKKRVTNLDTVEDVRAMLLEQSNHVRQRIESLTDSLHAMKMLSSEIAQMKEVNFKKYADILLNVQVKNEHYWMIKHFDDETMETFRERIGREKTALITVELSGFLREAYRLLEDGVSPKSEEGQLYAARFWGALMEMTDSDPKMLAALTEQIDIASSFDDGFEFKRAAARAFMDEALSHYIENKGEWWL
ncbi:MAG: MerR family transcriptional regulator [Defluviitaleaceae bacterium]|nr:MerR family transcriptional regulator [Defluviitaleaceae bacterium]